MKHKVLNNINKQIKINMRYNSFSNWHDLNPVGSAIGTVALSYTPGTQIQQKPYDGISLDSALSWIEAQEFIHKYIQLQQQNNENNQIAHLLGNY